MAKPDQPFSVIEPWKFEAITPGQFITFTTPNTLSHRRWRHTPLLRIAVLDSPIAEADDESPVIATMMVPKNLETDWIFCSESGHHQLLFESSRNVSRLILIGNTPPDKAPSVYKRRSVIDPAEQEVLTNELKLLLMPLHPKVSFNHGSPETLFLTYEDDVAYRVTIAKLEGAIVGEFLVEDVELVGDTDRNKQLRRRLRFKRMPMVVQSEALLLPIIPDDEATTLTDLRSLRKIENATFEADPTALVHDYFIPMVAGLLTISSHLSERIEQGFAPTALCFGIGGGILLNFLNNLMEFQVTGVEADLKVLNAAREYFGFIKPGSAIRRVIVGDAIDIIQNFPTLETYESKFDVVFVDLNSSEAEYGFSAPPPEFVKKSVFEGLRSLLDDHGVLIINVVPLNEVFCTTLVKELKEIFHKVCRLNVGLQDDFVAMATLDSSNDDDDDDNAFLRKLRCVFPGTNYGFQRSFIEAFIMTSL